MVSEKEINRELSSHLDLILDVAHDDLLITNGEGIVLKINPAFESVYGLGKDEILGKSVYQLEREGYFKPSIVAIAIEQKKRVTLPQKTNTNRDILVTAMPVYDEYKSLKFVISFSRDITELNELQKKYSNLKNEAEQYKSELQRLKNSKNESGIIAESEKSRQVLSNIRRAAEYDANVIITGPSGVGKTMFAKEIHKNSSRRNHAFVEINCAAIPENLLESEFFGYEKGAFTGALEKGKMGLFELANGGTLFLDEVTEIPLTLQAKLLKVLQDKVVNRVGGVSGKQIDFRLVVATNKSLEACIREGTFRDDLYYRLNVFHIEIPPLAERRDDIIPLCRHFLGKFNEKYDREMYFDDSALKKLYNYSWPGNIREVANIIERTAMMTEGSVIGDVFFEGGMEAEPFGAAGEKINLTEAIEEFEGKIIRSAYEKTHNTAEVARMLSISQPTAYRKVSKYVGNIER